MRFASALLAAALLIPASTGVTTEAADAEPLARYLWQPSMNVFRRFAVDRAKMTGFYGDVLGLKALRPFGMPGGGQMTLFEVGTSQVKLTGVTSRGSYTGGEIRDVTGLRVIRFFFPDEAAVAARFAHNGYAAPAFAGAPGGRRIAMVRDPDGQWVELVIMPPGTAAAEFDKIEVGLTVADVERSRAFYREFVGLREMPPRDEPVLKVTEYPYVHGTFTINLWAAARPGVPANTASAGIQYVVSNVDAVDVQARTRQITIDQPLANTLGTLRTIWLSDPDGITNYFAETTQSRAAREPGAP